MTTRAPETLVWLYREWEKLVDYPSATFSGIVPDAAHLNNGGYHVSIEDLVAHGNGGDYSNVRTLDKRPPVTSPLGIEQSAALDVSLSKTDMVRLYGRVKRVFDDRTDPRRKWLNYWNVWNGVAGNLPDRFNFQSNTMGTTSRDHEWHSHSDVPRAYVDLTLNSANCWTAVQAKLSVIRGELKEDWDMPTAKEIAAATWAQLIGSPGLGVDPRPAADWLKDAWATRADLDSGKTKVQLQQGTIDAIVSGVVAALPPSSTGGLTVEQVETAFKNVLNSTTLPAGTLHVD
jgi:hypothetical protein